jgi:hypothetical protein
MQPIRLARCCGAVPRFFFDLHNDMEAPDEEGVELPGLEAAKAHALCEARTMIRASVAESAKINLCHHIDVRDETGTVVYVVHFEDAVTVKRGADVLSRPAA